MTDSIQKETAENWKSRGFSCDLWIDPPGQHWEDFTHATDEVVMVLQGQVVFEVEGQVYHPKIGEELLIPAGTIHSVRNIGGITSRWLYGYRQTC